MRREPSAAAAPHEQLPTSSRLETRKPRSRPRVVIDAEPPTIPQSEWAANADTQKSEQLREKIRGGGSEKKQGAATEAAMAINDAEAYFAAKKPDAAAQAEQLKNLSAAYEALTYKYVELQAKPVIEGGEPALDEIGKVLSEMDRLKTFLELDPEDAHKAYQKFHAAEKLKNIKKHFEKNEGARGKREEKLDPLKKVQAQIKDQAWLIEEKYKVRPEDLHKISRLQRTLILGRDLFSGLLNKWSELRAEEDALLAKEEARRRLSKVGAPVLSPTINETARKKAYADIYLEDEAVWPKPEPVEPILAEPASQEAENTIPNPKVDKKIADLELKFRLLKANKPIQRKRNEELLKEIADLAAGVDENSNTPAQERARLNEIRRNEFDDWTQEDFAEAVKRLRSSKMPVIWEAMGRLPQPQEEIEPVTVVKSKRQPKVSPEPVPAQAEEEEPKTLKKATQEITQEQPLEDDLEDQRIDAREKAQKPYLDSTLQTLQGELKNSRKQRVEKAAKNIRREKKILDIEHLVPNAHAVWAKIDEQLQTHPKAAAVIENTGERVFNDEFDDPNDNEPRIAYVSILAKYIKAAQNLPARPADLLGPELQLNRMNEALGIQMNDPVLKTALAEVAKNLQSLQPKTKRMRRAA